MSARLRAFFFFKQRHFGGGGGLGTRVEVRWWWDGGVTRAHTRSHARRFICTSQVFVFLRNAQQIHLLHRLRVRDGLLLLQYYRLLVSCRTTVGWGYSTAVYPGKQRCRRSSLKRGVFRRGWAHGLRLVPVLCCCCWHHKDEEDRQGLRVNDGELGPHVPSIPRPPSPSHRRCRLVPKGATNEGVRNPSSSTDLFQGNQQKSNEEECASTVHKIWTFASRLLSAHFEPRDGIYLPIYREEDDCHHSSHDQRERAGESATHPPYVSTYSTWMAFATVVVCFFLQKSSCAFASTTGRPLTSFARRFRFQGLTLISFSPVVISLKPPSFPLLQTSPKASCFCCTSPSCSSCACSASCGGGPLVAADHFFIPACLPWRRFGALS